MSVEVRFSPVSALPDAELSGSVGPVNAELAGRGLRSLVEAAAWLRDQPYGHNDDDGPLAIFTEGVGTCVTKHGAFVTAAEELGVEVSLWWGTYALTDEIVTGVGEVLRHHELPFVPRVHCFVRHGDVTVDLTEGNCNGKNVQITEYLRVDRVAVGTDEGPHLLAVATELAERHPAFGHMSATGILQVLDACGPAITKACRLAGAASTLG